MIKNKAANMNEKLVGSLVFDEMRIRKMLQYISNKMIGFEYLPGIDIKEAKLARDALVFLFVGINVDMQIPVAYYFVSSTNSMDKSNILSAIITEIQNCDVILASITFDGHKTNPKTCIDLGANFDVYSSSFKPWFEIGGKKIRTIFDPSHMQKLARSTLGANKILYDGENQQIKWDYFKKLVEFKTQRNLGSIVKISYAHINYSQKPMKVKLAVETLSKTNANLMERFMNEGHRGFQGAKPTATYTSIFNDVFDVCNSTDDSKSNVLKNAMSSKNISAITELFTTATEYIKSLQIMENKHKVLICKSAYQTAYIGYIVNMQNLLDMFNELVVEKKIMQSIRVHKISQDHIEVKFGRLRNVGGCNNNPNCQQFNGALNNLLSTTAIGFSNDGNCTVLEDVETHNSYSNISTITSRRPKRPQVTHDYFIPEEKDEVLEELNQTQENLPVNQLNDLTDLNVAHVAGRIEERIEMRNEFQTQCERCKRIFETNEKVPETFVALPNARRPCQSTYDIGKTVEHILRIEILKGQFESALIFQTIYSSLNIDSLYSATSCEEHADNSELIKQVLKHFIHIRCNFLAKRFRLKPRIQIFAKNFIA